MYNFLKRFPYPCIAAAACGALIPQIHAQSISFTPVAPSVLEERVKQVASEDQDRMQALKKLFEAAGCPQISEQAVPGAPTPNVVCTLPGTERNTVVVGAHYGKPAKGDGVIRNWSGAALLPSLLESLNKSPRRLTYVFVGFSDQQKGLRGSKAYAKDVKKDTVKAMLNIESLGLGPTKIWLDQADKNLVSGMARVATSVKVPISGMNLDEATEVDSQPFKDKNIPTIHVHSISAADAKIPGSEKDTAAALQMDEYGNTYRLLAVYLAFLDNTLGAPAAK
ncbi:MAG TPA: M28 family peptidase [Bryobacteraceae bacterium]|nr:M28 family peptidase [Bryobacteraceae bacterium]